MRLFRDDFTQEMPAQDEVSQKVELAQKRKALSGAQKRMEELDKIIQRLYEEFRVRQTERVFCIHRKTGVTFGRHS